MILPTILLVRVVYQRKAVIRRASLKGVKAEGLESMKGVNAASGFGVGTLTEFSWSWWAGEDFERRSRIFILERSEGGGTRDYFAV
jgi:hypothetical protein